MVCAGKKHDEHFSQTATTYWILIQSMSTYQPRHVIHVIIFQKFPILASFDHWDASWPVDLMTLMTFSHLCLSSIIQDCSNAAQPAGYAAHAAGAAHTASAA